MQNFQVFLALILQEIPIVLNILEFKKKRKKEKKNLTLQIPAV